MARVRVSHRLRLAALQARSEGRRQYDIARQAADILGRPLHQTTVSSLLHDIVPVRGDDDRVIALGRALNVPAEDCFEPVPERRR